MKTSKIDGRDGNVLLCAVCTIAVVSIIGANVLMNCTTRYNVSSSQVRGWKDALYAAESAGDLAFAEIRKTVSPSASPAAWTDWTNSGSTHTKLIDPFGQHNLSGSVKVEPVPSSSTWYRIRAKGTAPVMGMRRVGMDDRMTGTTRGDSLLRKIDFNYDHFLAAYGPNGDGTGKAVVPITGGPQISRRIELLASPVTPFEAAIKVSGNFYGLGSAAFIDSYNSQNGAYYFAATNPSDPHYNDSRSGSVEINKAVATIMGSIYGNVLTNGGTVTGRTTYVVGTIDNNVPFTPTPLIYMPASWPIPQATPTTLTSDTTLSLPSAGSVDAPVVYSLGTWTQKLTIPQYGSTETYVAIHATQDILGQIDVKPGVHVQVFFDRNINVKARDIVNESGLAGNLQFYGSPPDPTTVQSIAINPPDQRPATLAATFYAPNANFTMNGNPDFTGAIVGKSFYGNGNTSWHYDRALNTMGDAVDFRIASYVEDIR